MTRTVMNRNVLKRDSKSIKAYTRAGLAHLGLGQPEAAAAMFKQALQLDASYSAAQVGIMLEAWMSRKVVDLVGKHHDEPSRSCLRCCSTKVAHWLTRCDADDRH